MLVTKNQPAIDWGWWTPVRLWIAFSILVGLLWLATPLVLRWLVGASLADRGQAGDQYDTVNALFAGLAFAAFGVTLLMQYRELRFQREQLTLQRQDIEAQKYAAVSSAQSLNQQLLDAAEREKRDRTIALHAEYNSDMVSARLGFRKASKLDVADKWQNYLSAGYGSKQLGDRQQEVDVQAVLYFFARVGRLAESGWINDGLAWELLGRDYNEVVNCDGGALRDHMKTDPYWRGVLRDMEGFVRDLQF